jgi:hypothetical protein
MTISDILRLPHNSPMPLIIQKTPRMQFLPIKREHICISIHPIATLILQSTTMSKSVFPNPYYYSLSSQVYFLRSLSHAVLIDSNCFKMRLFASMKRSTQFAMQGSSYLSSLGEEIFEVMHLRKHMSVKEWTARFAACVSTVILLERGRV